MKKIVSVKEAANLISNGSSIMAGGFLTCGAPDKILDELINQGKKDLTLICNDTSFEDTDRGKLIAKKCVKKVITSHIGTNPQTIAQMNSGELEVELVPLGTLIEKIRAYGAGLGGILTPTGVGTLVEEGKRTIEIEDKKYIYETPLGADFALIYGTKVDKFGNVAYYGTTRNVNTVMATSADTVIVQADEIVEALDPNEVIIPGVFIDYIVLRGEE